MKNLVLLTGNIASIESVNENVTRVSIAVNDSYKDKESGEYKENTNFFNLSAFGSQAKNIQVLGKGDLVTLKCHLTNSKTDDKFYTNIIVDSFDRLLKKK